MPASRPRLAAALVATLACLLTALPVVAQPELPLGRADLVSQGSASGVPVPFAARTVTPGVDLAETDPVGHDLVLVQADPAELTAAIDAIPGTGAALVQPLAPVSYLVWADAGQTRAIRALDGVTFAGRLPADLRVAGSVTDATTLLRVTLVGSGVGLLDRATAQVARTFTAIDGTVLTIPGTAATARTLARLPQVYSVAAAQTEWALRGEKTVEIIAQDDADPEPLGYDPVERFGADGSGVTVAVIDGGVDTSHLELIGHDFTCTDYALAGALCLAGNTDDAIGHGTFVTGVLAGDGSTGIGDDFLLGQGVAPGVDIHVQNAINLAARRPSITELFADSAANGAAIAQNSWGPSSSAQGYDEDTRQADVAVRDADPSTAGNQPMTVVFSIMNGSGGTSTQGSPDEAKNIIAVGGTGSSRAGTDGDDLCTCSAHGPNLDGSLLVDVVAPGQEVASTRALQGTLCGIPHSDFPSPLHAACTGTSFASPHVSGVAALFIQRHTELFGVAPSPATVRGALIATTTDLSTRGGVDADGVPLTPIPNQQQGWGRVDLGGLMAALDAPTSIFAEGLLTESGETAAPTTVTVPDGAESLRVTLTWTDAPGHGMGGVMPSLVNNLGLSALGPDGSTWLGNDMAGGLSRPHDGMVVDADGRNNVEHLRIASPAAGEWDLSVVATTLMGDGVPGEGDLTDQDYSLVVVVE